MCGESYEYKHLKYTPEYTPFSLALNGGGRFSPRSHPYSPCFAPLSRERLSLHCSPNSTPGVQCSETLLCSSPTRPFASVRFDPLAWSSGSDHAGISGCGIRWLLAGPDSLPLWLCRVCAFVLLRCFFLFSHCTPKEHSLGVIFFSSLSSCKCCIFLQFYLHFTTDYTCMIVYVTNNKEPWTLETCYSPLISCIIGHFF